MRTGSVPTLLCSLLLSFPAFAQPAPPPQMAEKLVATDPVIRSGEMVAEYHKLYASAALMAVTGIHGKIAPP